MEKEYNLGEKPTIYQRAISGLQKAFTAYAVAGSLYMLPQDVTGHLSADLATGRSTPTAIDTVVAETIADTIGVDFDREKLGKLNK